MKILQLVTRRQYRGAEVFAAHLSSELIHLDHEIFFVGLYKHTGVELEVKGAINMDIAETQKGFFSFGLVASLIKVIKKIKPDVVQCNGSDTLKYMIAASYFVPKVPILYRNISIISKWVTGKPKTILYRNFFKRVSHVTSVGEEAMADFISTFDYPRSRISVISRGIPTKEINDPETILRYRNEMGIKEDEKVAIHVGNFSPEKNHEFLLNLFSKIKAENGKIKLVCVGSGILFEEIKNKIIERKLDDTIYLLGFRKDIPELLAAAHCFVLSSTVEGVPGVILEAAVQKIPSVATMVGGVSEVLIDGKTGYLIDNFDIIKFKEKLLTLILNNEKRIEMGNNAYNLVQEQYNPARVVLEFQELYLSLIQEQLNIQSS